MSSSSSSDDNYDPLEELAKKQNPSSPSQVTISNKGTTSLKLVPAQVTLPPYTDDPLYNSPEKDVEISGQPISSATSTTFEGRRAQVISFVINQPIQLQPNSEYAYPINRFEDGEITHFTVAMNDPDMRVVLTLYDDSQRPDPMCNESVNDLILLGRGLTHGEAIVTDVDGVSVDPKGEHHTVLPYVLRYKHTFSFGFNDPDDYTTVAGTSNDKWFVIEYEPTIPAPYKKIFFTVQNPTNNARIIHSARIRRYAYLDSFNQSNPTYDQNPANLPLNQALISGQGPIAQMARKSRLSA
jgi:hypothetical protein